MRVPLHTVIKLTPQAYGTKMEEYVGRTVGVSAGPQPDRPSMACPAVGALPRFPLEIEAVDTHRDPRKKGH